MKPYLLQTVKTLAMLGAMRGRIDLSSKELAQQMNVSQQTASRYLLELDKIGVITRELGIKKQLIHITDTGIKLLEKEYSEYQQIFEVSNRIILKGRVVSGLGEGKYYTEQDGYKSQFKDKLGFIPYPGTLNIEVNPIERNKIRLLKTYNGIAIDGFKTESRTFGNVKCFQAMVNNIKGAVILPLRSHYSMILEFISPVHMREASRLKDGDEVEVIINIYNEDNHGD
jgi:riboflavin kinase